MTKIQIITLLLLVACFGIKAQNNTQVSSPDGKLIVTIGTDNGKPYYELSLNGKQFLVKSPLGLKTNVVDFSEGLNLLSNSKTTKIDENYELPNIKKSKIHYVANMAVFSFKKDTTKAIDVTFSVSRSASKSVGQSDLCF